MHVFFWTLGLGPQNLGPSKKRTPNFKFRPWQIWWVDHLDTYARTSRNNFGLEGKKHATAQTAGHSAPFVLLCMYTYIYII